MTCFPARPSSVSATASRPDEVEAQAAYHRRLFASLYEWERFWGQAVEMAGDEAHAAQLGLDQLGHFGPNGVELLADRLLAVSRGPVACVLELGSGFGGVLRHMRRALRARRCDATMVGVEFVPEHCALATAIGHALGDSMAVTLVADVRKIPLPAMSVDAVLCCGSASHFAAMADVLVEARRVLRPEGTLVMLDEVGIRPAGAAAPGEEFLRHHPADVFAACSGEQRRSEVESAGLRFETVEPLTGWAIPLLRQQVQALRFMEGCATDMFGAVPYQDLIGTLTAAADEYERGSIEPWLLVARREAE